MKVLTIVIKVESSEEAYRLGYHLNESAQKFLKERFNTKPINLDWLVDGKFHDER